MTNSVKNAVSVLRKSVIADTSVQEKIRDEIASHIYRAAETFNLPSHVKTIITVRASGNILN